MIIMVVFLILCILSWQDYKDQQVNGMILIIVIGMLFLYRLIIKQEVFWDVLYHGSIGIGLLAIALIWKESIGLADGLVFIMTGMTLGVLENIRIAMIAFFLATVLGVCGMCAFHKRKNERIAFIPLITTAYGIVYIVGVVSGNGFIL